MSIRSGHEPGGLEATGCRKDEQVRLDSQAQEYKADAVTMVSQWDGWQSWKDGRPRGLESEAERAGRLLV